MDSNLKIGDKVRRTTGDWRGMNVGDVDEVVAIHGRGLPFYEEIIQLKTYGMGHAPQNLEVVQVGPVSETTVVKKTINEGVFGPVHVCCVRDDAVQLRMYPTSNGTQTWFEPSDLRSMVETLTQLADAMEAA